MKKALGILCIMVVLVFGLSLQASAVGLQVDKTVYAPGDSIQVSFTAPPGLPRDAWIGIIPSNIPHGSESQNDQHDLAYQYLEGQTTGTMVFTAPGTPGSFDVRMNSTDNNGQEITSITFTVAATVASGDSLKLDKNTYAPGESIQVSFTTSPGYPGNAWIGIIPSNIPHGDESQNDQHDLAYQYLEGKTSGALVFTAPAVAGSYDFRLHTTDNNGKEVASVSFNVGGAGAPADTLTLNKNLYAPGESIQVSFTTSPGYPGNAWIGIIPSNIPHGDESQNDKYDLAYQYLEGKTSGALVFTAPAVAGTYDFRLHTTDNNGKEVASVTFEVR
jgi:uncharacterized protein YfaS (alpha-2-macroglobulin family)